MAREIKFKVDVDTEASVAELRKLRKEIRDVAAGSEEFKKLQQNIDDIQDSLVASRASAGNFFDILGQLPGPIGSIGSAVGSTVTALKQFTLIKFSDLAGSVVELGKDFLDIGKNILNLTGITKVYTVVNETLTAAMTALGIAQTTAATASRLLAAALTATGLPLGTDSITNQSTATFVAYLFATAPGISKVFSYTGNGGTAGSAGTSQTINCGFSTGARFVMIKCTSHTSDWVVADTTRGIIAGNDNILSLNTTAAEVTTTDLIDTDTSGFIVNQLATGTTSADFNVTSRTYIGLAFS